MLFLLFLIAQLSGAGAVSTVQGHSTFSTTLIVSVQTDDTVNLSRFRHRLWRVAPVTWGWQFLGM